MPAISNIKVRTLKTLFHIQYDNIFPGKTTDRQVKNRDRIHAAPDKFADLFRDLLDIGDTDRGIILF